MPVKGTELKILKRCWENPLEGGYMAKNNFYRKVFKMDRFGRAFYCQHARLGLVRSEKRQARKKVRVLHKQIKRQVMFLDDVV